MERRPGRRRGIWAIVLLVLGALGVVGTSAYGVVSTPQHGYDMRRMGGDSMRPSYVPGERVWFEGGPLADVRRGDVVLVSVPWVPGGPALKRVVAVGGDRISYTRGESALRLNGEPLAEPYLLNRAVPAAVPFDVTVPTGRVFLMGDNRGNSNDSSFNPDEEGKGTVAVSAVLGRAIEAPVAYLAAGAVALCAIPLFLVGAGLGVAALVARRRKPAPALPVWGAVHVDPGPGGASR